MSDVDVRPETVVVPETDTPDVAHVIRRDRRDAAYLFGEGVEALCGHLFVPTKNPYELPKCERCQDVLKQINAGRGGNN